MKMCAAATLVRCEPWSELARVLGVLKLQELCGLHW